MNKVALYIRVSTEEQVINWNWIEIQKEALIAYVKSQWYQLDDNHIFIDEWKSWAKKENRPALYNLFQSAKNKEFYVVLVWKIDRFFRKTSYLLEWIEALDKMWVWFISITQNINTTNSTWKLTLTILWWIAEMERENIKERTHSWILVSMKKWKLWRWKPVYWYRKDDKWYLYIDKEEAKVIKMIYSMLLDDWLNTYQIAEKVNSMNIETSCWKWEYWQKRVGKLKHKNFWHRSTIHNILTNEIYSWVFIQNRFTRDKITNKRIEKPKDEWIVWESPKIVSKKTFEKAKIQLEKNLKFSSKNTKKSETYMLAKLIKCWVSWFKLIWYKSSKWTKNYRLSVVWKSKWVDLSNVKYKSISALKIETAVWNKLKEVLVNPNILKRELERRSMSWRNQEKEIRRKISLIDESIQKLNDNTKWLFKLVSWLDEESILMVQSEISENKNKIKEIRKEKDLLEKELSWNLEISEKINNFQELSNIINNNLDNLDYETKTELCKLLIKEIILDWEKVSIKLLVPISPRNRLLLKTDVVKDFFNENKEFIKTKFDNYKNDIIVWLDMMSNLRTYLHQYDLKKIVLQDFVFVMLFFVVREFQGITWGYEDQM